MGDEGQAPTPAEALRSPWVVAAFALVGLLAGLVLFAARTAMYEAETLVTVNSPLGTMGDEAALVESGQVAGVAAAVLGFEPDLRVEPNEGASLLTLIVRADDPDKAAQAANEVASRYQQAQTTVAVRVASPAVPDPSPVSPNRLGHMLFGSAIGAGVGLLVRSGSSLSRRFETAGTPDDRPEPLRPARPAGALAAARRASSQTGDVPDGASSEVGASLSVPPSSESPGRSEAAPAFDPALAVDADRHPDHEPWFVPERRPSSRFAGATGDHERPGGPTAAFDDDTADADTADADTADDHAPDETAMRAPRQPTSTFIDAVPRSSRPAPRLVTSLPIAAADDEPHDVSPQAATSPRRVAQRSSVHAIADRASAAESADGPAEVAKPPQATVDANEARFESELADQQLRHEEALGTLEAHYERQVAELKREVTEARKRARTATSELKRLDGDDQHRVGDLEAQATALEAEITSLRHQLETERIAHLRELTAERETADRALDAARREFRDRIDAHDQANRQAIAGNRAELDDILSEVRSEHQAALDRQQAKYESALRAERERHRRDQSKLAQRHTDEVTTLTQAADATEAQLKRQTKQTLAELRAAEKRLSGEVEDLRHAERQHRNELMQMRKALRNAQQKNTDEEQTLRDELALTRKALQTEKERNAALREDVVRRTAEAHQAVDRAIDERSSQLAELEALVARQRDHAEQRIREATVAAEERVRESSRREAELMARIGRLERELGHRRAAHSDSQAG